MLSDDIATQLHHRASLGERLSAEEQVQLAEWYAAQDAAGEAILSHGHFSPRLQDLREQVKATMALVSSLAEQNRLLVAGNEALRREIEILQQQLRHECVVGQVPGGRREPKGPRSLP